MVYGNPTVTHELGDHAGREARKRGVLSRFAVLAPTIATAAFLCAFVPGMVGAQTPKVLLIGIDGVRADVLAEVPRPTSTRSRRADGSRRLPAPPRRR